MIILKPLDRSVKEETFPFGVKVTMRPASSIELAQARDEAARMVASALSGAHAVAEFGLPEAAPATDVKGLVGLSRFLAAALVFEQVVSGWRGVAGEDGQPAPLDRRSIGLFLLESALFAAFERLAFRAVHLEQAEGNGFAASPAGTAGAAAPIATDAGSKVSTAGRGARRARKRP
ncbi:hypothetical protein H2509_20565 [Stappia sp. F7233]|uniref:Uncharacterized protein n=1 Tax=Stappia albiluteola TaxID=2758565 RepID=A0A839AIG7_9HYPH|nr:hypothetical protein [Stappia albiluteola]MBA5779531.1 hypothetical protein [Stappia albiluteola]